MHTLVTLSSPHLGFMYNQSSIVNAGMWLLKRWKKSKCLQQLSFSDAPQLDQTYLYKLTKYKTLSWFKNIILIASH